VSSLAETRGADPASPAVLSQTQQQILTAEMKDGVGVQCTALIEPGTPVDPVDKETPVDPVDKEKPAGEVGNESAGLDTVAAATMIEDLQT